MLVIQGLYMLSQTWIPSSLHSLSVLLKLPHTIMSSFPCTWNSSWFLSLCTFQKSYPFFKAPVSLVPCNLPWSLPPDENTPSFELRKHIFLAPCDTFTDCLVWKLVLLYILSHWRPGLYLAHFLHLGEFELHSPSVNICWINEIRKCLVQ